MGKNLRSMWNKIKIVRYVKQKIVKEGKEFVDFEEQKVVYNGERLEIRV